MALYMGQYLIHTLQTMDKYLRKKGNAALYRKAEDPNNTFSPNILQSLLGGVSVVGYMKMFEDMQDSLISKGKADMVRETYYPFRKGGRQAVNEKLPKLLPEIKKYFVHREFLYYRLYQWHAIGANDLRKFGLPYEAAWLENIEALQSHSITAVLEDTKRLLDTYFRYYLVFISNEDNLNKLGVSVHSGLSALSKNLYPDLDAVWQQAYSLNPPSGEHKEIQYSQLQRMGNICYYQYPQRKASFDEAFEEAFPELINRREHAENIIDLMPVNAYENTSMSEDDALWILRCANPVTKNEFRKRIGKYPNVAHKVLDVIGRTIAYEPILDADALHTYTADNFVFAVEPLETRTQLNPLSPFEAKIEELSILCEAGAHRAGFCGPNEKKVFIRKADICKDSVIFEMTLGAVPCFTGDARLRLFTEFLYPGNEGAVLDYLKERNSIGVFLPGSSKDEPKEVLLDKIRTAADLYYKRHVYDVTPHTDAGVTISGDGIGYMGCGTFILSDDKDADGNDRPYLLLELRRKVTQEAGGLGYPSAGSCDLYMPYPTGTKRMPPILLKDEHREHSMVANPFKTALRELQEELGIDLDNDVRRIQLISFGMDITRNLQQFSFLHESPYTVNVLLACASMAEYKEEGTTFPVPFQKSVILEILRSCQLEPAAVWSLLRILELKKDKLWPEVDDA